MPASLFSEMERSGNGLQDERALQLALELSMLGLSSSSDGCGGSDGGSLGSHAAAATVVAPPTTNQGFDTDEPRMKKSQNMTECVPVPSSEHVAEIVGRQGEFILAHAQPKGRVDERAREHGCSSSVLSLFFSDYHACFFVCIFLLAFTLYNGSKKFSNIICICVCIH